MMPEHSPAPPGSVPTTGYREFTGAALLLGLVQGIILNLAFVYISLKLAFSISGSTIAAIRCWPRSSRRKCWRITER